MTRNWVDHLSTLVHSYNHTPHRTLGGVAPAQVSFLNSDIIHKNIYGDVKKREKTNFKVGDTVKLNRLTDIFAKGYEQNWTRATYLISSGPHYPRRGIYPSYTIANLNNKKLPGKFEEPLLQKVDKQKFVDNFAFPYEIIRTKGDKQLVRYIGYNDSFNRWIPHDGKQKKY